MFNFLKSKSLVKSEEEILKIAEASKIVAIVHEELRKAIKPGITGLELDKIAEKTIREHNGIPAFLGYDGFPASICFSKNETLVHGIPNNIELIEGDIVSIDVGVEKDGYFGDAAFTVGVGNISEIDQKLIDVTRNSLKIAIENAKPGMKIRDLGKIIQNYVESNGFEVTRDFVGHGIGKMMHEQPSIPNFYDVTNSVLLEENMTICIEPMVIIGTSNVFIDPLDKWSVRTKNGKNCAHEEHTILITNEGGKILSKI